MYRYCLRVLGLAAAVIGLHCAILLLIRAPIAAEYWVREMLIVKRRQVSEIPSPKLLLLGGSSTLFGFDSSAMERAIGRPVYNFGVHASMRLEWILSEGRHAVHRGDTILVVLEPPFYECASLPWGQWQVRNSLAWGRDYLQAIPWWDQIRQTLVGGSIALSFETLRARAGSPASLIGRRREALADASVILSRYPPKSSRSTFAYAPDNITALGDIRNTGGSSYAGLPVSTLLPGSVCPQVGERLKAFVADMRDKGAKVIFDYPPYLVDGTAQDWQRAERTFSADMARYGLDLLGARNRYFFPGSMFFNTDLHLNEEGRRARTARTIESLTSSGYLPALK